MYIENTIVVRGKWSHIWELSSQIEKWVERLPHYRKIIVSKTLMNGLERHVYMSAWRDILPVGWYTIQRLEAHDDPNQARITYHHVGGVTKGMDVIWSFEQVADGLYRITISHDWKPNWSIISSLAAKLISELIVHDIADKTLTRIRQLAA